MDSGTGPQPISELVIGTSGTIAIYGACLDGSSTISVGFDPSSDYAGNSSGVNISNISAPGYGAVTAHYSVTPGTMPETLVLTVTTFSGSASANLDVVTAGPYIEGIIPDAWPANTSSTTVTISDSGFGTNQGALSVVAPAGDVSLVNIQLWSDNQIVMNVSTGPNSAGETVTITVTGGTDNALITGFQNSNSRATGNSVSGNAIVAGNGCGGDDRDKLIIEYNNPQNLVSLRPACTDFRQTSPTAHFSFSSAQSNNYLNWGDYSWAILTFNLGTSLDTLWAAPNPTYPLLVSSGYRNPAKEQRVRLGTVNGPHTYGYSVDFQIPAGQQTVGNWQQFHDFVKGVAGTPVPPCIEPLAVQNNKPNHLHVDWRGTCPPTWN